MPEQIDSETKNIYQSVLKVFNEIQKLSNFNKTHIFELIKIFKKSHQSFAFSLQQVYLKIFKTCLDKTNKKIPTKYEILVEALFRELLDFDGDWQSNEGMNDTINLFNSFISLTIEAVLSSVMNIRIMGAKITFLVVKLIPQQYLNKVMSKLNRKQFVSSTINLLRAKITTYRQLGAKLASLAQKLDASEVKNIESEMLKIASLDQNEQIRKMVITNLLITPQNIDQILIRLRDKNMEIRSIIIKKLQNQNYIITSQRFHLSQIYKLLYDGFGSKQESVKNQCLHYYSMYFEESRGEQKKMEIQDLQQSDLRPRKNIFNKFSNFVKLFSPEILLLNPHLYNLFDTLVSQLIEQIPAEFFIQYISDLLSRLKKLQDEPQKFTNQEIEQIVNEIIWVKHCVKAGNSDISSIYQQKSLTGTQLGQLLIILVKSSQLYGTFQLLQLFQNQLESIPDEYGRNQMFNSLRKALINIPYFSPVYHFKCEYEGISMENLFRYSQQLSEDFMKISRQRLSANDDICTIPLHQQIQTLRMMLSSYNAPIVASSFDLIPQIVSIMKILRPLHYEIQVKQVVSQLIGQQQKRNKRDIELALQEIRDIQLTDTGNSKSRKSLNQNVRLKYLFQRCIGLQQLINKDKEKIRNVILALSKVSNRSHVKHFWSIVEEILKQKDQSNGLVLLALQSLDQFEELQKYFEIFWMNFMNHQIEEFKNQQKHQRIIRDSRKNSLLISIRAIADFVIKYDMLNPRKDFKFKFDGSTTPFSPDFLMKSFFKLLLHSDGDVRILSLEALCRLMYHQKIHNKDMKTIAFTYLLLLWWSTDGQVSAAKSVHTISRFFKFYIDPTTGKAFNQIKLAQGFCVFFKLIMLQMKQHKRINKSKIIYNLKLEQFLKKAIAIATAVLKEKKDETENKQVYSQLNLKAQQLFVCFLLSQKNFQNYAEKSLQICNFYENSSIEVLILTKQVIDKLESQGRKNSKNESFLNKFEVIIQEEAQKRNVESYEIADLKILSQELNKKMESFNSDLQLLLQHIAQQNIFVDDDDASNDQSDVNEVGRDQSNQSGGYPQKAESYNAQQLQEGSIDPQVLEQIPKSSYQPKKMNVAKRGRAPIIQPKIVQKKVSPPPQNIRITRNRKAG